MKKRRTSRGRQILMAFYLTFLAAFSIAAQTDPDPNSPTPILISQPNGLRALATDENSDLRRARLSNTKIRAFPPNSKILLYVTNLDLMEGEGANAFRVNVEDSFGRQYRFPVLDIAPVKGQEWVYALTVELRDVLEYNTQAAAEGDVLISVVWRGLASNRLRLGYGKTGGTIKDDANAKLVPFPTAQIKTTPEQESSASLVGPLYSGDRTRFMEQATFGPTPALDNRIRRLGLRVWLAAQFSAPYPTNPYPDVPLMPVAPPDTCDGNNVPPAVPDVPTTCRRDRYSQYLLQNWFFKEAFYGDAQLRHRVAFALSQIWVVSGFDIQQSSHTIAFHQKLGQNAFGNYRTLMSELTLNPAMGSMLDMVRNTRQNPNENFSREVLQLFTIGLYMLNQDGTQKLDGQGNPIPTYDQETVNNFTKVFTGFGYCINQASCPSIVTGSPNFKDPMLLVQNNHNVEAKTLLSYCGIGVASCATPAVNQNIAPNLNGNTELQLALDNIFYHPNVAPFVSRRLIQHLVTSDPSPAYVGRISAVFNNNGAGVRGDLKEVVRAILLDPEARGDVKTDPAYGKLREPAQLTTNILRQFGVRSANGTNPQSDGYLAPQVTAMGQNAFNSPSVFNFYAPGYTIPGLNLNAPEFGIMTTGTSISRVNALNELIYSQINTSNTAPLGTSIDLSEMQALAAADASGNQLLDVLNTRLLHGTMSEQNRASILSSVTALPATDTLGRARAAIYSVVTSSQYQIQR